MFRALRNGLRAEDIEARARTGRYLIEGGRWSGRKSVACRGLTGSDGRDPGREKTTLFRGAPQARPSVRKRVHEEFRGSMSDGSSYSGRVGPARTTGAKPCSPV